MSFDWAKIILETQCAAPEIAPIADVVQAPSNRPLDDDGPTAPCPKCGGRNFWRPSMTRDVWQCRRCVAPLPTVYCDGVFLPPPTGEPR